MEILATIEALGKSYPVLNYLVPLVVAMVFAQREVKKRHERHDQQRAEDLAYRANHEVADMAHRKASVDAIDSLTKTVKDLSTTMSETQKIQLEFQRQTNEKFLAMGERLLFMEGQLQQVPYIKWDEMNKLHERVRDESIGQIPDLTEQKPKIDSK